MPELPDIVVYIESLQARIVDSPLERIRLGNPFLLRSVAPPIEAVQGRRVHAVSRLGKRIVIGLEDELFCVLHLMVVGRLQWRKPAAKLPGKLGLAAFDFPAGTLILTEAGSKKRASLHLVQGVEELARHDPGGLEVLDTGIEEFGEALRRERHTLKRALTDPRIFSGIGNAYSDEILHRAGLSPFKLTDGVDPEALKRLYRATVDTLREWTVRLREETALEFPTGVTAFREGMAVHGRYGQPCPVCGAPIQRIVYAQNEANYCAKCQTDGKLLADRALSRLLRKDWPRTIEGLERKKASLLDRG